MTRFFLICAVGIILTNYAEAAPIIPSVNVEVGTAENPEQVATTLQVIAVLTLAFDDDDFLCANCRYYRLPKKRACNSKRPAEPSYRLACIVLDVLHNGSLLVAGER